MILLDTDICIEILRGNKKVISRREKENDTIAISFLTVGELYYGAYKSTYPEKNIVLVEKFVLSVDVLQSNRHIMKQFGELKARLIKAGTSLPDADIIIAATSLSKCKKLITGNTSHFNKIDELKLENWSKN